MARGIPTTYDGVNYRSRLEARWAAFFTAIGWQFTYEPFDATGYIPDFLIHGPSPLLVEVKPAATEQDYRDAVPKIEAALDGCWDHDVLIVGLTPTPKLPSFAGDDNPIIGMLGEWLGGYECLSDNIGWAWQAGHWSQCLNCGQVATYHPAMSFSNRPCGCYSGDHYLGPIAPHALNRGWKTAGNAVQWNAHRTGQAPA